MGRWGLHIGWAEWSVLLAAFPGAGAGVPPSAASAHPSVRDLIVIPKHIHNMTVSCRPETRAKQHSLSHQTPNVPTPDPHPLTVPVATASWMLDWNPTQQVQGRIPEQLLHHR